MSDTLASNRSSKTSIGSFDQLVVLTQRAINNQFKVLRTTHSDLQRFSYIDSHDRVIDAMMDPFQCELLVASTATAGAILYMTLTNGKFCYREAGDAQRKELPFRCWKFAFDTSFNFVNSPTTDLPDFIKNRLEDIQDYSVQKLFICLTSVGISSYNESRSTLPGLTTVTSQILRTFVQGRVSAIITETNRCLLGHEIIFSERSTAASGTCVFSPTSLRLQTYAYTPLGGSAISSGLDGDYENNMLVFLQAMSTTPALPSVSLAPSDNWVIPNVDNIDITPDGCLCISHRTFLHDYLIPKLAVINADTKPICIAGLKPDGTINPSWSLDSSTASVPWQRDADANEDSLTWKFGSHEYVRNPDYDDPYAVHADVDNTLTVSPGGSTITVTGTTAIGVVNRWGPFQCHGYHVSSKVSWTFTITLQTITGGGIKASVSSITKTDPVSLDQQILKGGDLASMQTTQQNALPNMSRVQVIAADVQSALMTPRIGSSDFVFTNPIFNSHGDLLIDLKYQQYVLPSSKSTNSATRYGIHTSKNVSSCQK